MGSAWVGDRRITGPGRSAQTSPERGASTARHGDPTSHPVREQQAHARNLGAGSLLLVALCGRDRRAAGGLGCWDAWPSR
jgi:hypothetical protein